MTNPWPHGMGDLLLENYKLQNTNYKQIPDYNVQNYKQKINQQLLQGGQGDGFHEKSPVKHLAAGGKVSNGRREF